MKNIPYWDSVVTLYVKYQATPDSRIYWFRYVLNNCFYGSATQQDNTGQWVSVKNNQIVRIPYDKNYKSPLEWFNLPLVDKPKYWTMTTDCIIAKGNTPDLIKGRITDAGITEEEFMSKYKLSGVFNVDDVGENIRTGIPTDHIRAMGGV